MTTKTVITDKLAKPTGPWLRLSSQLTRVIQMLSSRDDLIVNIAPGKETATGAPGAMLPQVANIELNADYWPDGVDPASVFPGDKRDWERYPQIMGLLAHEASHADHSQWSWGKQAEHNKKQLSDDDMRAYGAAELLEESRIEAIHMRQRPQDAPWLAASATTITLAEALELIDKGEDIPKSGAARAAALLLARNTAGSLPDSDKLDDVRQLIVKIFGTDEKNQPFGESSTTVKRRGERLLNKLEDIWTEFQDLPDDAPDEAFMKLGADWYKLTGDAGDQNGQDEGDEAEGGGKDGQSGLGRELREALKQALGDLHDDVMGEATGTEKRTRLQKKLAEAAANRVNESAKKQEAKDQAKNVFNGEPGGQAGGWFNVLQGFRPPTTEERKRAHRTYVDILRAYYRAKAVTKITSALPPGRLNARKAMTGEAQASMGLQPSTEPFSRRDRRKTPNPPLKVGIIQDASGSQDSPAAAAASGAWSLAMGVRSIPDGQVAMVTFGDRLQQIINPRMKPKGVPEIDARGGTQYLKAALQAVEGALNLMRGGAARLVVIVTDGFLYDDEMYVRDAALKRLLDAGVKILWVMTASEHTMMNRGVDNGRNMVDQSSRVMVVPQISHPNFKVVYPYDNSDLIPDMITREAVKTLAETNV